MSSSRFCSGCNKDLPLDSFYTKGRGRLQSYCKTCLCKRQMARWVQRKIKAIEFLGGQCALCGYNRNYAALDFHHREASEKEFQWNRLRLRSWAAIENELSKCVLLCKNCHMEQHHPHAALPQGSSKKSN